MLQTSANSLQVRRLQVQQQQFFPFFCFLFIYILTHFFNSRNTERVLFWQVRWRKSQGMQQQSTVPGAHWINLISCTQHSKAWPLNIFPLYGYWSLPFSDDDYGSKISKEVLLSITLSRFIQKRKSSNWLVSAPGSAVVFSPQSAVFVCAISTFW